jgi:hypothetical protein
MGGGDCEIVAHPLIQFCFVERERMRLARLHGHVHLGHLLCDAIGRVRIGLDRQWRCLAKNQQQDADGECE